MATKAAFKIQLQGFAQASRDAEVELTNVATGQTITRKPFLDGSLVVRDLDPGAWELKISEKTVKMHRALLMERLGVPTSADLIRLAVEAGL